MSYAPIRIDTFMFHSFFNSLARSRYLSFFSLSFGPINCRPMMCKIRTAQIREKIYNSLTSRGLFPDEQKGCCKGSRGTAELLYIDQHILNESKTRRKNLAMAWIDYKKAITIGISLTFMFHSFFSSLEGSKYLSLFAFFQFCAVIR